MEENRRPVLRSVIRTLTIQRGRIVILPENVQQVVIADQRRIEGHFDHFGVTGLIGAHILISGFAHRAAHIADLRGFHPGQPTERGFHAPKTSRSEGGFLHVFHSISYNENAVKLLVAMLPEALLPGAQDPPPPPVPPPAPPPTPPAPQVPAPGTPGE